MLVLEITLLMIKNKVPPKETLPILQKVRRLLAEKVHPTKSRFFSTLEDPSRIFILGSWPTVEAHHEFLDSELKDEILGQQEGVFTFLKGLHIPLPEIGEEVENWGLPLSAEAVGFEGFYLKPGDEHLSAYTRTFANGRASLEEATKPHPVFGVWRMDCMEGEGELVIFTGWKSKEEHEKWLERETIKNGEFRDLKDRHSLGIERWHLVDLER